MLRVGVIGACYGREYGGSVHFGGSAVAVLCGGSPGKTREVGAQKRW
jgi:hypothetical protein